MKSYIRKIPLLLIVVLLGVITFGCSKISNNNFPMDSAEIQKAIDKHGLEWVVEEEISKDHELSSEGYGKVFRLSKNGDSLGAITSFEKGDIRLITVNLTGSIVSKSENTDAWGAEEKKENWDKVFLMMGDLYGNTENSKKAYENMMIRYEEDKDNEDNYVQYSEQFDDVYYNVFFTKRITVEHSTDQGKVTEEVIEYGNNASISVGNKGGNKYFLTGIEKYKG